MKKELKRKILIKSIKILFETTLNVLGGDSITQLMPQYAAKPYHEWIKELLGLSTVNNYGMGSTSIAKNDTGPENAFCVRYANMDDNADIVIVAGGVNDLIHNSAIGEYGDTTQETFYGALHILCNGLRTKYPMAMIFFITPTNYNGYSISTYNRSIYDYVKAIKTICDKFAIPVYDNRVFSGIYPNASQNASAYTADGLHWNDLGHEIVGKSIANWMLNLKGYPGYMYIKTCDATAETPEETYLITYNLSNCSTGNTTASIDANGAFSTTITANGGYVLDSVTVTMGGEDITATAVSNNTIYIASVTGNIVITATADAESVDVGNGDLYTLAEAITSDGTNGTGINTGVKINSGAPDITLIVDFQLAAATSYGKIIASSACSTSGVANNGLCLFYGNDTAGIKAQYGYAITKITSNSLDRHQIGVVFDRTNKAFKVFADGALTRTVNNESETEWLEDNENKLCLLGGYYASTGTAWCPNATIYHCDVYSGALTDEQVISKMNSYT